MNVIFNICSFDDAIKAPIYVCVFTAWTATSRFRSRFLEIIPSPQATADPTLVAPMLTNGTTI